MAAELLERKALALAAIKHVWVAQEHRLPVALVVHTLQMEPMVHLALVEPAAEQVAPAVAAAQAGTAAAAATADHPILVVEPVALATYIHLLQLPTIRAAVCSTVATI